MSCPVEAYPSHPLARHLAGVAGLAATTLGPRLSVDTPAARVLREATGTGRPLLVASVLAGLLHDLGKASTAYCGRPGSYWLHEHASAILVAEASNILATRGERGLAALLMLAAQAVSRHHAAMEGRLPRQVAGNSGRLEWLRRVLQGLTSERLQEALPGDAPEGLRRLLHQALNRAGRGLRRWGYLSQILRSLDRVNSLGFYGVHLGAWTAALETVSGALIVSDILVADAERRSSDDRASPLYARIWASELGLREDEALEAAGWAEARRILEGLPWKTL